MILRYDVIVVGGGHAGTEAACASARLGARTLLVTANLETIGQMSCNPAIGGIAKGTVAREVDALGGVMGRATDLATIQFRMLNRSKGPAVWSPRAQCDRGLYRRAVRWTLESQAHVDIVQGTVMALLLGSGAVGGVRTTDGRTFGSSAVVLTAGTFLRGRIHIGTDTRIPAGRAGDPPSVDLALQLETVGLEAQRFKTGTPPRIDGRTVDYSQLERQDGEWPEYRFANYAVSQRPEQRPCWVTWSDTALKEIVTEHLHESALYGGEIAGRGPRYCPSIEDKIVRFPHADRHQVFLEPEGLDTYELYVNGLSTSLPISTQVKFLQSVTGLSKVRITRPGYAIEYDYYPPNQLTPWLEVRSIDRLFLAGQINGSTGYEEAAGQGVLAGINAARRVAEEEPIVLGREDAYIGVLIDDLVTKGVDEPYRLFTSRAEYRLLLRQDNSLSRLGPLAAELGMLTDDERRLLDDRLKAVERLGSRVEETTLKPHDVNPILLARGENLVSEPRKLADLVKRPGMTLAELLTAAGIDDCADREALLSVETETKYKGYIAREREAARRMMQLVHFRLPQDLPYLDLKSLSTEARVKLDSIRPESLARAGRIPGISPSDLQNLVIEVVKHGRTAA